MSCEGARPQHSTQVEKPKPRSRPRAFASARRVGEAGVVGDLEELVEGGVVVAAVVDDGERGLVGELLGLDEVAAAELGGVDAELARRLVDDALELVAALGAAGAAVGVDGHGVGEDRLDVHVGERGPVGAAGGWAVQVGGRHRGEEAEVGAEVGVGLGAEGEEHAVLVEGELDLRRVVAALGVGDEGLGAAGGPFHRPAEELGGAGDEGLLAVVEDLRAEAAADVRGDDAQLGLGDAEDEGAHQEADDVRVLAGGEEGVFVGAGVVLGRPPRAAPWRWRRGGC